VKINQSKIYQLNQTWRFVSLKNNFFCATARPKRARKRTESRWTAQFASTNQQQKEI
jgi:hypothetical protein